jgi:hypothetical protein
MAFNDGFHGYSCQFQNTYTIIAAFAILGLLWLATRE